MFSNRVQRYKKIMIYANFGGKKCNVFLFFSIMPSSPISSGIGGLPLRCPHVLAFPLMVPLFVPLSFNEDGLSLSVRHFPFYIRQVWRIGKCRPARTLINADVALAARSFLRPLLTILITRKILRFAPTLSRYFTLFISLDIVQQ